ncbi:MAG: transglutaminase domain-containing protein [Bacteroides sp.]|nr:transglutaminase domain-containing protein [Bacteroides sp.]
MRKLSFIYGVMTVLIVLLSCCKNIDSLGIALDSSGTNRKNLEAVLRHFKGDSLKYEVSAYLISNMRYNATSVGDGLDRILDYYRMYAEYGKSGLVIIDSMRQYNPSLESKALRRELDVVHLDSTFIIKNIEKVFSLRDRLPWCRNIPTDIFVRYVTPYRVDEERLSNWRDSVYGTFLSVIDSLITSGCESPLEAGRVLMKKWNEKGFKWTSRLPAVPAVGIANVFDKAGTCREFAHGVVYLMRAAGIPSGIDMVNVRGENNSNHFWPFILDENGNTYVASTEDPMWRPASDFDIQGAKIYRQEYGVDTERMEDMRGYNIGQPFFALPKYTDVTSSYKPSSNFTLTFNDIETSGNVVYLMLASHNKWVAVDISIGDRKPVFHNVAGGVVGWLGKDDNGELKPISHPFEISETTGEIRYIEPSGEVQDIVAFSKYPMWNRNGDLVSRVVGGVIEGSDSSDFEQCDTIFKITEFPKRRMNFRYIDETHKAYRYYRYRGADSTYCNIAELGLYRYRDDERAISGRVFSTSESSDDKHTYMSVFDGDLDTSFDCLYPSGGWSAIDMGIPVRIEKIMYAPRNRDNYVRAGDIYELFYFDDGRWISTGTVTARADSVSAQVPKGTLYYLKNHTRGKDERIFEYDFEKSEQRFW